MSTQPIIQNPNFESQTSEVSIRVPVADVRLIAEACVARLSPHTQRAYLTPITSYLHSGLPLAREGISAWLAHRKHAGAGPVTLNLALSALKLLAREVWIREHMDGATYNAIADLKSEKRLAQRLGRWTDEEGVEGLLEACADARERALIAVMCGCGLRRAEVAGLRWEQYQERAGRMCLCNITGKGGRVRTVAVPEWAREIIDEYGEQSGQLSTADRQIRETDSEDA